MVFHNLGTGTLVIVPERIFNQSSCSKKVPSKKVPDPDFFSFFFFVSRSNISFLTV